MISVTPGTYQLKWIGGSKGFCGIFKILLYSGFRRLLRGGPGRIRCSTAGAEGGCIFGKRTLVTVSKPCSLSCASRCSHAGSAVPRHAPSSAHAPSRKVD